MKKIIYIGWLNSKNVGDDLMIDIFNNFCDKYLSKNDYEIHSANIGVSIEELELYDTIVLGGGSIILDNTIDVLYEAVKRGKKVVVWGSGYDWIREEYIGDLKNTNKPQYILSFSDEIKLGEIIKKAEFFGIRGPLTKTLLKNSGINIDNLKVVGDIGFCLEPSPIDDSCPIFSFKDSDKVVAINWGTTLNRLYGEDEIKVENSLVDVCTSLIKRGYKIYIYTVWPVDMDRCISLYKKINDYNNVILDFRAYTGGELLSILKKCTFSINFKLHSNIISAVAGVPFVCLGYRFKCFDFVSSIDSDELIVSTSSENLEKDIEEVINIIENNYLQICSKFNKKISDYKEGIEKAFRENIR